MAASKSFALSEQSSPTVLLHNFYDQFRDTFRQYLTRFRDIINSNPPPQSVSSEGLALVLAQAENVQNLQRAHNRELLLKLLTTLLGLGVSVAVSYFAVKWLVNAMDPTRHEKLEAQKRAEKLMKTIGVPSVKLTEYELCIASNLVDPLTMVVDWKDIGGLAETIQEIQETVIMPFKHRRLFSTSTLVQPPKGVLLYGPPGCGKTMIAKATAKAAGARFINLQVSSLVDKWYGESQKRAEAVFSLAHKLQPTIIFIDEIDSFLRMRTSNDHEATSMIKTQFMSFWDGLMTDPHCHIMIMGATNRPSDVDSAILRRMPCMFNIALPDVDQRKQILRVILRGEQVNVSVDLSEIARMTEGFSGSDLRELCRNAAICRIREYLQSERQRYAADGEGDGPEEGFRSISTRDFQSALDKMRQTKQVSAAATMHQIHLD